MARALCFGRLAWVWAASAAACYDPRMTPRTWRWKVRAVTAAFDATADGIGRWRDC